MYVGTARGRSRAQLSERRPGKSYAVTSQAQPVPMAPVSTPTQTRRISVLSPARGNTNAPRCDQSPGLPRAAVQASAMTGSSTRTAMAAEPARQTPSPIASSPLMTSVVEPDPVDQFAGAPAMLRDRGEWKVVRPELTQLGDHRIQLDPFLDRD